MKRRRSVLLLLFFGCLAASLIADSDAAISPRRRSRAEIPFTFTAPVYNISLEENARGSQVASSDGPIRMGVPLPDPDSNVKFKIVEGDKGHHFKAFPRQVGDFVFLRIRQKDKHDMPLNRELKDHYEFLVKATCKRKNAGNLETTALVRLRITDRNDASPMFTLDAERYEAEISDKTAPFSDVLRLEASDADVGVNGQIYYSMVNKSSDFMVDPVSGWVRTLRPLRAGTYTMKVRAEDRTSRIFYYDEDQIQPDWTSEVAITVIESKRSHPKILVEKRPIDSFNINQEQLAALIVVEGGDSSTRVGLVDDDLRHWFHLNKTDSKWQLFTNPGRVIAEGTNVTLSAGSELSRESNTTATIKMDTVVRHGISFGEQSKIRFLVEEAVPLGFVVGKLSADCSNKDDVRLIRYHLESLDQNTSIPFRLNEETGMLRVSRSLDYEHHKLYEFNVFAKLSGLGEQSSVLVEVAVRDSNDHSPLFAAKWTRQGPIPILPSTKLGTSILKISALDRDAGENGRVSYKLSSDKPIPFDIDFDSGDITLSSALPKNVNEWRATAWAVDWGQPWPRSTALNLVFYRNGTKIPQKPRPVVSNEPSNENAPVFETTSPVTVAEDTPIGKIICSALANDADIGYNGLVSYSTWDDFFSVNMSTGELSVAQDLTKLLPAGVASVVHEVEVIASDRGEPSKIAKTRVSITVSDVNNNDPQFDRPWYRVHLSEDTAVGSVVLQVAATDDDSAPGGTVGYRFASAQEEFLDVDEKTGKVTLIRPLDREINDVISSTLVAFDHGVPQRMSFVNVTIEVDDVNDNAPRCVELVTKVRIPEDYPDGALVGCVAASDADLGANARLRFSLDSEDAGGVRPPFRVDHHTGCVFIHSPHRPLDYQIRPVYNLTVDVADNGETVLSTSCYLVVELLDVDENLHPPEFDDVAHEASVYENMPIGTEVFRVIASDPDNKDAQLRYSIVGGDGQGYFTIDSKGTIRTASVLDREEQWKYWLAVDVADDATVPQSAVLHVFVNVLDKNDHRPVPSQPIYFANIKENSPQNTVVVKLEASDADDMDAAAQPLQFKIVKGDPQSYFRIDSSSGYITTSGSRKLDRETQREHELMVSVCDNGEPARCSTVPVVVTIDDVNDNAPSFSQSIHHYNVPSGVTGIVCRVFAVDPDAGVNSQLYYNITSGGDDRFSINEDGYISTKQPLGSDEVFALTIQVTDRGRPAQLAQSRVVLTGSAVPKRLGKNRPPIIKDKSSTTPIPISDADQVGLTIAMMEAADEDGDSLWWSIVEGNVNETFSLRPDSGALLLAKPIDNLPANLSSLTLTVRVTDLDLDDTKKVLIQLSRSPTRRPVFSAQHYRTQISEKTAIGTQIYTLKATADAVGSAAKPLVYGIYSVEDVAMEDKIRIEPSTGNVLVMESLDYETCREIRAIVSVRQGQLMNYATLTVGLTDDNDNPPRFLRKEHDIDVPVSAPVGSIVGTLVAHDADSGTNGVVTYSIVSGNELGFFSLDPASGAISVAKTLSDIYGESILTVRATDGGTYALTGTATARIRTITEEHQRLKFSRSVYQRSVRESTPIGSVLLVVATDPNGQARFSMKQPCPHMDVHPLSGAVTLTRWLTRQRSKSIECTVIASTNDGQQQSAKVVIKPTNTNQHSPVFKQQVYRGTIRENAVAGSSVLLDDSSPLVLTATDKDSGPNALIGYRLLNPSEPYFVVDFVSGAVRTRKPLDFEKLKEWTFHVQASDMGQPVRTSPVPALVVIRIEDENDEAPVFEHREYAATLVLPTVTGIVVARPRASDKDTIGRLRYFIKDKSLDKLFALNSTDGSITVVAGNDSEYTESHYKLEVFVSDGVHSSSCIVRISVDRVPEDVYQNSFRCAQREYSATLVENTTFDEGQTVLSITAIGTADGTPVTYRLLTVRDEFILNHGTGVLALTGPALDREKETQIRLLAEARTVGGDSRVAHCVIVIRLDDVNDCSPHFTSLPYSAVVSVDAKPGHKVLTAKAVDEDYGSNGMVQYSSTDLPKEFKLNKHDGKISIAGPMKEGHVYKFHVQAADQGSPSRTTIAAVRIEVVEKARPVFSERFQFSTISESAVVGTTVATARAISNTDGHLVYSIEDGNGDGSFAMDWDTGILSVARPIDRETNSEYNLTVMANDVTRDLMNATCLINVKISGVNDNGPRFTRSLYRISVTESTAVGSQLIELSAVDPDGDDDVTYAVSGADSTVVKIDMESGVVVLASPLDFEKKQHYDITVIASDASQFTGESRLVIDVTDMNDEPPRFVLPFATADLSDVSEPGQFIAILSVTDEDTVSSLPDGHRLLYSVIDGDETLFNVDGRTGEVTLARPVELEDVSTESKKLLNVSVSDGVFTAYGQLTVNIVLSGLRQPAPRFEQSQYVIGVRENNAVENRSALLTVHARDGLPPVHYYLGGGKEYRSWPVRVDKLTGRVHQKKSLSRSNVSSYVIPLVAEDALGRRAFSTLTLNVIDENDTPPTFIVKKYSSSVSAGTSEGDSVLMVSATDPDEGDSIEYSLTGKADVVALFKLHPRQGTLSLGGKIDKYVGSTIALSVTATDMANPPHHSTAEIELAVLPIDTPIPKFSNNHYLFNVQEDSPVGTVIGKMQQIESAVEAVRFVIAEPEDGLPFMIERSSGKLIVRGLMDWEQRTEWRFAVRADAPGGAHSTTTVTIQVVDVDDNAPVFHGSYARQSISEDAPIGTSIAVFSATDADRTSGGRIEFSILESDGSEMVRMDSESGWLLVAAPLDRETSDGYDLTARATDRAGNTADVKFHLEVTDVNDEAPQFDESAYTVNIDPSTMKMGQSVGRVRVKDKDLPPFNITRLFISRGNDDSVFSIDDTGRVSIARLPLPATRTLYNLTLLAFDGKHSTTAIMKVNVKPRSQTDCSSEDILVMIREDSPINSSIVNATSTSGSYSYQLVSSELIPFAVDAATGRITTAAAIDAEKRTSYSFSRRAQSVGRAAECWQRVSVNVIDVNDNSPVFSQKEYPVTIKENLPATPQQRLFVVRVHATDKDSGLFGTVRYTLADGHGVFVMDERSGSITAIRPLDREQKDSYVLHVLASDSDPVKPRSSKAIVRVSVADQNDNAPLFDKKEYNLQVMESESVGYNLITVHADGGDEGEVVTYGLTADGPHNKFVHLDTKTGVLSLAVGLDYEKDKVISVIVTATDNGTPPLSSQATVQIQVLDENDNAPVFTKTSYQAGVKENSPKGTKIVKVEAKDADSEHYGRVEYSLQWTEPTTTSTLPFSILEDGWIVVDGDIDREKVSSYKLSVDARDGGNLTSSASVTVEVLDENDNAPVFAVCNMTAVVQEGVSPGHTVLSLSISDADGASFAGPFKVDLKGEGRMSFLVDDSFNIRTAARLDHSKKDKFLLTVIATDSGGLSSDCPLTVYVKEESRHPPHIVPLLISLNTLKGEFRGGHIGVVKAIDQDTGDMLRFSLVDGSVVGPLSKNRTPLPGPSRSPHQFRVEAETGQVWAEHSIASGVHGFNVSVTDGKFNTVSYVEVEVVSLESDSVDHAVAVRVLNITPEQFFGGLSAEFARVFSKSLNLRPENINFLSVQDVEKSSATTTRLPRGIDDGIDVLFTVTRGFDGVDRGMLKPDHIYSRLKQEFPMISLGSNMKYQLTTEVCTPGVCQRGECRERIELSDQRLSIVSVDGVAFVAPRHSRVAECSCPEGYGGQRCDVEVNACSRSPCQVHEMCSPDEDASLGFECICPPGTTGQRCQQPACSNEGRCLEEAELSVSGNGYFEMSITNDVETRMELEVEFRTVSVDGTLMHSHGMADYHSLEIVAGRVEYRWDAGAGEGVVKAKAHISDGKWHRVRLSRRGRRTRLSLDDGEVHEGWSPSGAEVLNLQSASLQLTFGAMVKKNGTSAANSQPVIQRGVAACFRMISLDGRSLAKTRQGLRLQAASPGCRAMAATPCSDAPCKNGATCHAMGKKYSCLCPHRYEGDQCEVDREPCADHPCPVGIQCIPFYNAYLCKCPSGFTGQRCEGRGQGSDMADSTDACAAKPCGAIGECISIPRQSVSSSGYICNCTHGLTTSRCDETFPAIFSRVSTSEIYTCLAILVLLILVVVSIILVCKCLRRRRSDAKYGDHVTVPHMRNPHVVPVAAPPPLPPRGFRGNNKYSNLQQAQMSGLPTVQVRPYPANERMSSSGRGDSRSPSLAGSGKHWKTSHDYGSAADDLNQAGRGSSHDARALEALRRIGVRLSDDDASSTGSGGGAASRARRSDRAQRRGRDALDSLNQDRCPLGDSIQCLPTVSDEPVSKWHEDGEIDRIGEAVRKERLRMEGLTGRMRVGETVLSPLVNDDDYMTMRPRKATDSAESQRRPLLGNNDDSDGPYEHAPPLPPAHKNLFSDSSRLYDDPMAESQRLAAAAAGDNEDSLLCDIDASDTEQEIPIDIVV